ncbi:adhesion G-protein coupled receptor F2 [Etheostoma cragini]|uniref:adhesion G-protein coupled receptor F2 n=1 Tax=Etheostoma cragini TaxID=417921 RepID=UPI00155F3077|nr:adhesion G-protein coupled receptor F2 [Etheostoma cragini]
MQTKENWNRMWAFIILCLLGLSVCQANGEGNSTQMHYVKLIIEESAIDNITKILKPFDYKNILVDNLKKTTLCQTVSAGTVCSCMPDFRWSNEVCQSQKCCGNNDCTFANIPAPMCVSNNSVAVTGSIYLKGVDYQNCLKEKYSKEFQQCNDKLLKEVKTVFSTLTGFDILTIKKYRLGSIIADFEMIIAYSFKQQDLIKALQLLSENLSASLNLVTTGFVHLYMTPSPVCSSCTPSLICTLQEDLNTPPVWQLKRTDGVFVIFNGTESEVTSAPAVTSVGLNTKISERWEGEYSCTYTQKLNSYTITHKASGVMDIALLPDIHITTVPEFPRCRRGSDFVNVRVNCVIGSNSKENYTVTWKGKNIFTDIIPSGVYSGETIVSCDEPKDGRKPQLTCNFKNICDEHQNATIEVNIIYENDSFCPAEGDWRDTKANYTAYLKCPNAAGQRQRKCSAGKWGAVVEHCVNLDVNLALQQANIVDVGLGSKDQNAANVFSLLGNITNNTKAINSYANMNAAVQVLISLSQKSISIVEESAVDDFLESSSNLLEPSLKESWTLNTGKSNSLLADSYLNSVEKLIQKTNKNYEIKKNNLEVAASICTEGSKCNNTVFDVTVNLNSPSPGSVKTAGFKELQNYFPEEKDFEPNSIVVSTTITTTASEQLESVNVNINFQLLKPRPRNVRIKCVSWDNNTRSWSEEGCEWKGSSEESLCTCTHLSSFAILMSRYPTEINGLTDVTYVGLSISVVSLVITMVIELTVWSAVVKTIGSYLRHTVHMHISLCLLIANCCFLASSNPKLLTEMWCKISVLLKHFCYLSMFFWMLCLSSMLLHKTVFPFHQTSKKAYMRFFLFLGYVCPLLIVVITFLGYNGGAKDVYFSSDTCWLRYSGLMKGSIHTFVIPVGIIVFFNVFSMLVVIMKLLDHPINTDKSNETENEKKAAITALRSVILLTPIFGVTWIFGFAVMVLDLTIGTVAFVVNYVFTLLNAFQGLFILLTTCLGDKLTREALLNRLRKNDSASTTDSSTKLDSTWKQ